MKLVTVSCLPTSADADLAAMYCLSAVLPGDCAAQSVLRQIHAAFIIDYFARQQLSDHHIPVTIEHLLSNAFTLKTTTKAMPHTFKQFNTDVAAFNSDTDAICDAI
jgi:hypothetical protein